VHDGERRNKSIVMVITEAKIDGQPFPDLPGVIEKRSDINDRAAITVGIPLKQIKRFPVPIIIVFASAIAPVRVVPASIELNPELEFMVPAEKTFSEMREGGIDLMSEERKEPWPPRAPGAHSSSSIIVDWRMDISTGKSREIVVGAVVSVVFKL
jgi:hypothetical protein